MLKSPDAAIVRAWLETALRDGEPLGKKRTGLAAACGVSSQAVTGWQKTGRITKTNLEKAIAYFGHGPRFTDENSPAATLPIGATLRLLADHLGHFDTLTRQAVTPLVDRLISHPDEAATIAPRVERMLAAEPHAEYYVSLEAEQQREAAERDAAVKRAQQIKDKATDDTRQQPPAAPRDRPSGRH